MFVKVLLLNFVVYVLCSNEYFENYSRLADEDESLHPYFSLNHKERYHASLEGGNVKASDSSTSLTTEKHSDLFPSAASIKDDGCGPYICSSSTECWFHKAKGCFALPSNENYTSFTFNIELSHIESVMKLTVTESRTVDLNARNQLSTGLVSVELLEQNFTMSKWQLNSSETFNGQNYVSRTSSLVVRIEVHGNWSGRSLLFEYEEVEFEIDVQTLYNESGEITLQHKVGTFRPNCVKVYRLSPPHLYNDSSVMITLWYLDVDESVGEYLVIGAGKDPFEGPPGMFITGQKTEPKKYFVAADDVYVAFVARSSNRNSTGFKLSWLRNGTRITNPKDIADDVTADSVLQSMPICIYNSSFIQEFYDVESKEDIFPLFREKLAQVANQYAKEKELHLSAAVRNTSVRLIRISAVLPPDPDDEQLRDGAISVMVTIVRRFDDREAVFRAWQLGEILDRFDRYDEQNGHALLGTKVGKCPEEVDYTSWKIGVYVLVPVFCVLFFGIWLWRYTSIWKSRRFKSGGKKKCRSDQELCIGYGQDLRSVLENEYVLSPPKLMPKIRVTTEEGRNYSADSWSSYFKVPPLSDEDSDVEIFNKLKKVPRRRSDIPEQMKEISLSDEPGATFQAPSFERKMEGDRRRLWQHSNVTKMMNDLGTHKTEHVYDSLGSTTMNIEQFEYENMTKL